MNQDIYTKAEPGISAVKFVLVPDSGAARRLKRVLAQDGARTGCVVGVWRELVELAARAYLVPIAD